MKTKLHYVLSMTMFLVIFYSYGQESSWKSLNTINNVYKIKGLHLNKDNLQFFELNTIRFNKNLAKTSSNNKKSARIILPNYQGGFDTFNIQETSVFAPSLAKKYPNIKSYKGISANKTGAKLYMSNSPKGMQAMIMYPNKANVFIHQVEVKNNQFVVYTSESHKEKYAFSCINKNATKTTNKTLQTAKTNKEGGANNQILQKFRIAISTNGEYTAFHGGTVADALAGINATLTRTNAIFETDMAITFELIDATNLIFVNANTDPYSNANDYEKWSDELENTLSTTLGNNNYDIGHLLGAEGGVGNGGCLGCVCDNSGRKGRGFSAAASFPEGDRFDLNLFAHEIGHQMGGNHTWAYESEGSIFQSEPGSGSTIMAYAGITGENNIQLDSDPYFHYHSIKQILDNVATKSCQIKTRINNNSPVANAGSNFSIPIGTPYILKGSATDADANDVLSYCWEQIDSGVVNTNNFGSNLTFGSTNRSLPPTESPNRSIPNINSVINAQLTASNPGLNSPWESVSTVARTLNWALTVRDRNPNNPINIGQTSYDTMEINVIDTQRPFTVTSQNSNAISWIPNSTETITWDVANTNEAPINASRVNILLSTDGGLTYPTTLLANTPNDGSQDIVVPALTSAFCRVKVEAANNIFYAINSTNFAINLNVTSVCPSAFESRSNLNIPILDGQVSKNTINIEESGLLQSIKVSVNISHTFVSDIEVRLTHPNGTTFSNIWKRNCSSEDSIILSFEDFATPVNCNATTSSATHAPSEPLTGFNSLDIKGTWEIAIEDFEGGDTGTLNSWSLELCYGIIEVLDPNIEPNPTPNDIVSGSLKIFPNPNKGNFNVVFVPETSSNINITVSDVRGRIYLNQSYPNNSPVFRQNIELNNTGTSLYFLSISDGTIRKVRKIIID